MWQISPCEYFSYYRKLQSRVSFYYKKWYFEYDKGVEVVDLLLSQSFPNKGKKWILKTQNRENFQDYFHFTLIGYNVLVISML